MEAYVLMNPILSDLQFRKPNPIFLLIISLNHPTLAHSNFLILETLSLDHDAIVTFFIPIFVLSHIYVPREEGTQVIVGSMNMGYISDTARNRTHNLFRPKREPIPLCHKKVLGPI